MSKLAWFRHDPRVLIDPKEYTDILKHHEIAVFLNDDNASVTMSLASFKGIMREAGYNLDRIVGSN